MALRIAVSGATGRMGRGVAAAIASDPELQLAGAIARVPRSGEEARAAGFDRIEAPETAAAVLAEADAVIDFSAPDHLRGLLEAQRDALAGRALVVGTTGLDAETEALLTETARRGPTVVAANFAVGVHVLAAAAELAARMLPSDRFDVEIVEAHHRGKADAPSGTALALGETVAEARGGRLDEARRDGRSGRTGERPAGEIGFHAVRGGGVVGAHRVLFLGSRETLEFAHFAMDRGLFADGAILAARWAAGRPPGRYGMRDVLGLRER